MAVGDEHRVVPETLGPPGRPHQGPVDGAVESLQIAIGPAKRQGAGKMGAAVIFALKFVFDFLHRRPEVLVRPGPARRMNAGLPRQRRNHEPGIVGQRQLARGFGRGPGLQFRIGGKRGPGLNGLGQAQVGRRRHLGPEGLQKIGDFPHLARVMAGDD